jgi:glycosyltransferase involved in cell wall biosynthesis
VSRSRSYRAAGISRHIDNLLTHLPGPGGSVQFTAFVGPDGAPPDPSANGLRYRVTPLRTEKPPLRILWEQAVAPVELRALGVDILHCPANVVPIAAPCPTVVTVHDLSFERFPHLFHRANRAYLGAMIRLAVRLARRIIAVSESTQRELVELLGVPSRKIEVIPNGVEPAFRPLDPGDVARWRAERGLPEQYVLCFGTLEPRKNIETLVRAYARLRRERDVPHALVLAGGKGWLYDRIFAEVRALGIEQHVHFPGFVPFDEQPLWYNGAAVFAYPSLYEGFGFPPLESMACGTPVVTSDTTSLPEVVGDAGLTVGPHDEAALADALWQLISDDALRTRLRAAGLARAALFDWRDIARRTTDLLRSAA